MTGDSVNERELAAELQETKDDAEEWDDALASDAADEEKRPKRRLAAMVSIRLTPAELEIVQSNAARHGETVSSYLRRLALEDARVTPSWSELFCARVSISQSERIYTHMDEPAMTTDGRWILTSAS